MRVLREVARRGSISAAADALSLSPSAVSQQVAALERETAVSLLERGPRDVRLTPAGDALVAHTDELLERLAAAEADLRAIAGLDRASFRLGAFQSVASVIVPQAIAAFRAAHPGADVTLLEGEPEEMLAALRAAELDLAVVYDYAFAPHPEQPALDLELLFHDPLVLVLPLDHPLAGRATVDLGALEAAHWVGATGATACAPLLERACAAAGFAPDVVFRTDDYGVACGLVAAHQAVALVPRLALRAVTVPVAPRRLASEAPARRVLVARPAGAIRSPTATAMVSELGRTARGLTP